MYAFCVTLSFIVIESYLLYVCKVVRAIVLCFNVRALSTRFISIKTLENKSLKNLLI